MRSTRPSLRSLASLRRVCSTRTPGAITRCSCSVVAIRYCTSTASASRSPPPVSTSIILSACLSCAGAPSRTAPRVPVTAAADPDHTCVHAGPTTVTKRQHRPQPGRHPSRQPGRHPGRQLTAPSHAADGIPAGHHPLIGLVTSPTSPSAHPRARPGTEEKQVTGDGGRTGRARAAGGSGPPCPCCASAGAAPLVHRDKRRTPAAASGPGRPSRSPPPKRHRAAAAPARSPAILPARPSHGARSARRVSRTASSSTRTPSSVKASDRPGSHAAVAGVPVRGGASGVAAAAVR
jgi:hypothetical protein